MHIGPSTRVAVTGASRGIGEAVARAFAARGAVLGLMARSGDVLEALAASLPGDGHQALPADVGDAGEVRATLDRFGDVDVLVANAGVAHYGAFASADPEAAERMTRVNWLGTVNSVQAVLPRMLERRSGHLVIVSSGAALRTFPEAAVYGATKAAQRGFAEALRHELHGTGVSLTVVYPGEIATHLHDHERDAMPAWYRKDEAVPAEPLAKRIVAAVEADARAVYHPPMVRLLRIAHGISPRAGDLMLRRMRGPSAAPRTD
jgi:short-subunit dehydrogenase